MLRSQAHFRLLLLGLLLLPLPGCNTPGPTANGGGGSNDASPVAATINGEKITRQDLDTQLEERRGREILDRLVMEKLIEQEARKQNITIPEHELQERLDALHKDTRYQQNIREGTDPKLLDQEMTISLYLKKLMLKEITEQDKLRFYDRFKDQLTEVQVGQILLPDKKEAERVRQDLLKGADFAQEAKKYSKDPASREQGGVVGWFIRNQLPEPFSKVAFDTPVGSISPVVQSQFGYHVVKVLDKKSTYDQLKDAVEDQLLSSQEKQYEDRLRAKATVTTMFDKDKAAAPSSPSAVESPSASSSPSSSAP